MESWYLLRCKSQQYERAQWHLENQGFTSFAPTHRVEKKRSGVRKVVSEPLFPGYLFVALDMREDRVSAIRSTRGVLGFVRFGGYPTRIPGEVIDQIKARCSDHEAAEPEPLYQKGTPVEVTKGPFAGLPAVFDTHDGEERCFILLDMMGKQQRLQVSEEDIDKAS